MRSARGWQAPLAHQRLAPFAALVAAELLKLNDGRASWTDLRRYLVEHPGFIWLLGFPLVPAPNDPLGFNAQASLPTHRHLVRMLRQVPDAALRFLLADSVRLILTALASLGLAPPECVSLGTKHTRSVAWVKENNPKTYVSDRFNKTKPPPGDPDCRLGCKRRTNPGAAPATPTHNPVSPQTLKRGQYYWGYGSGIVVTKLPELGEFVLAELTQLFDHGDVSYFCPLMAQTEARLGYRPRGGTFDAAFDAWYVYAYFSRENDPAGGFAAVPFSAKGSYQANSRQFSPEGSPPCPTEAPSPRPMALRPHTPAACRHCRDAKAVSPTIIPLSAGDTSWRLTSPLPSFIIPPSARQPRCA